MSETLHWSNGGASSFAAGLADSDLDLGALNLPAGCIELAERLRPVIAEARTVYAAVGRGGPIGVCVYADGWGALRVTVVDHRREVEARHRPRRGRPAGTGKKVSTTTEMEQ